MAPPRKTLADYEAEAQRVGECLIHPSANAARRVFKLRHGDMPSHIAVCHTCDTPKCINDAHHFPGTWKVNTDDAVAKGRHSCFQNCAKPGEAHPFFGGHHTLAARNLISDDSLSRWARVRALGLRDLQDLARHDASNSL